MYLDWPGMYAICSRRRHIHTHYRVFRFVKNSFLLSVCSNMHMQQWATYTYTYTLARAHRTRKHMQNTHAPVSFNNEGATPDYQYLFLSCCVQTDFSEISTINCQVLWPNSCSVCCWPKQPSPPHVNRCWYFHFHSIWLSTGNMSNRLIGFF